MSLKVSVNLSIKFIYKVCPDQKNCRLENFSFTVFREIFCDSNDVSFNSQSLFYQKLCQ